MPQLLELLESVINTSQKFIRVFRNFQAVIHDILWGDTGAIFPYLYINMGKIREHTTQMREKCVELHKSGNGYKK